MPDLTSRGLHCSRVIYHAAHASSPARQPAASDHWHALHQRPGVDPNPAGGMGVWGLLLWLGSTTLEGVTPLAGGVGCEVSGAGGVGCEVGGAGGVGCEVGGAGGVG